MYEIRRLINLLFICLILFDANNFFNINKDFLDIFWQFCLNSIAIKGVMVILSWSVDF